MDEMAGVDDMDSEAARLSMSSTPSTSSILKKK